MDFSYELTGGIALRPVQESDAEPLAAAFTANRAHLAPWEPVRAEEFFTVEGQQEVLRKRRAELRAGTALPMVLTQGGSIAGLLTLSSMVRGAFQNAHLGYWLSRELQGNGFIPTLIMRAGAQSKATIAVQEGNKKPRLPREPGLLYLAVTSREPGRLACVAALAPLAVSPRV